MLNNDTDADGDSITASLVSNVLQGTLSFSGNGSFTYTPNAGFIGTDTFSYQDTDGLESSTIAFAVIAVVENPPVANNDSYSVSHGQTLTVSSYYSGVLYNDTDADGDSLTASLVANVQHGTLAFSSNGTFTYTPAAGFYGTDTFTYKAYDGMEWSTVATVMIAVTENPPVAVNDSYSIPHGQTLTVPGSNNGVYDTAFYPTTPILMATRSPPRSSRTCSTGPCHSAPTVTSPTLPLRASSAPTPSPTRTPTGWRPRGRHRYHRRGREPTYCQQRPVFDHSRPGPLSHCRHQRRAEQRH